MADVPLSSSEETTSSISTENRQECIVAPAGRYFTFEAHTMAVTGLVLITANKSQEMALVHSVDGDLGGLITATDVMKAVVGELEDPLEETTTDSAA